MDNIDLSIIIVSWNVKDKLRKNLKAIYKSDVDFQYEIFIIDNNSEDGSARMAEKEFPQVKLIKNKENLGFSKANNQGIRKSKGRYILLLNPDMLVKDYTLAKIAEWMDNHKEAGVAGCRLIDKAGNTMPHVRRYPTFLNQLAVVLKLPHLFPWTLNRYLMREFDYSKKAEVNSIRGSFFIIRREVIDKIGLLDEKYFIWFEEVDYCRRVKNAGWKVMYVPVSECVDYIGQSFSQVNRELAQKYFCDSMLKYFKKWHPAWQYWILRLVWPIGRFIAFTGGKLRFKNKAKT